MVVTFNNSTGKDSAFALLKGISLGVYINRYTENVVTLKEKKKYRNQCFSFYCCVMLHTIIDSTFEVILFW